MKRYYLLLVLMLGIINGVAAQTLTKKVIFFKDKKNSPYSLSQTSVYLSAKAIQRRTNYGIAIDSTDLPVNPAYIDSVAKAGAVTILGRSKWLNAVIIQTSDAAALTKINSFPFVKSSLGIALRISSSGRLQPKFNNNITPVTTWKNQQVAADTFNYGSSSSQIQITNGQFLHNIGGRGQGMTISFLDAGFFGYTTNRFFDSARIKGQIKSSWDFVSNNANVNDDDTHGMHCFSIVAAYKPGEFVGTCPEASFHLLRTEDAATEQIIEEYNWALGAEYADSSGTDIISSSLGYTTFDVPGFDHTYADMDGNTTIITRMADMAASKGILVLNSAGNDGNNPWKYIAAPADGDSVLTVGSVNSSGVIAITSSYGPTSDGQIKPDVVTVGQNAIMSTSSGTVGTGSGTSYSCPNMAGIATCFWQLFPEVNNMKIITTLRKSSDRFTAPSDQYGYGIPNMKKATGILLAELSTLNATINTCTATLTFSSKDTKTMRYVIERKLPGETSYTTVQTIAAKGTVFSNQSYQFNDNLSNKPAGTVSYRIQQVIDTTTAGFYFVAIDSSDLTLPGSCTSTGIIEPGNNSKLVQLYPNPAKNQLTIKLTDETFVKKLAIQIFNHQGQLVYTGEYQKQSGAGQHILNIKQLPAGNYILTLKQQDKIYSIKEFVKQ
ncbi:MAG: S8/S53 family peptidase [Chitinophagaceae bacterium]